MELPRPPSEPSRLAFLGTPEAAVPALEALAEAGYDLPVVVSAPDRRRGRGGRVGPSPVKAAALELGFAASADMGDIAAANVDLAVVVAYGYIIPTSLLEEVPMVNIHFSDLPRWRGAAPVERAILAGDTETAVCLMQVVEGLDEGDVFAREQVTIGDDETAAELTARMSRIGARLLVSSLQAGFREPQPQIGEHTYAAKITNEDRHLDWTDTAVQLHRVVRIGDAWTTFRGRRLKVWEAQLTDRSPQPGHVDRYVVGTAEGGLELVTVQPEGKPRMSAADWARGARPEAHEVFGDR